MKGHPKGLYMLFSVELWERFGYYGMRALLTLYMVKYLMFSTEKSGSVYGWFTGLVYLAPLLGGYIADRYLGQRKCITIGAILMSAGYFLLGFSKELFFPSLLTIILGNGFFKPNISTIVGKLYEPGDHRRDGGFTIFYMGINIGAMLSPLIAGYLGENFGWRYGFWSASVGMLVGLAIFLLNSRSALGNLCMGPAACSAPGVEGEPVHKASEPLTLEEKQRVAVIFILTFFAIFFWAAFEQAGTSLTLFADRSTDRTLFGWTFPASWFQAVNPVFIILLALPFSRLWTWMADKGIEPVTPKKFAWGLVFLGLGFVVMIFAAREYKATGAPISFMWLSAAYFLHTIGELCLSPVGLSMVTKLAPAKFASLLMGTWFLSSAAANIIGGRFAGCYDSMELSVFFMILAATAFVSAFFLFLLVKPLNRWMHGVH
ncbi:MAG: peptide MFS transporter [Elusimicrobiales bacterium]